MKHSAMNITKVIENQRLFFNTNRTKELSFRIEQLKKLKAVLVRNEAEMINAIYEDFGKSEFDVYTTEFSILYSDISLALKNIKKWAKWKRVRTNLPNFPAKSYVVPEPFGVSLVIGAWNYPYQLSLAPVIAALTAGNTVILKPSELPENTSKVMAKMINENFDPRVLHVIEGGVEITTELLKNKFDKIFFTGSVPVGKIVYEAAAKHLTPVTLELGGKSPAIVAADANLDVAVKRLVWAKFLNAGQTCIAPDYIYVDAEIETSFLTKLKAEIERSAFSIENGNYVRIINNRNAQRLAKLIDPSLLYYGGKINESERIIEPTILRSCSFESACMQEEIFGPILPILTYTSLDEAIAMIKSRPKPLALYLFTNDRSIKTKVTNELSFGGGAINDAIMHLTNHHLPFGGVGDSGIGSYHGEAGFNTFSHVKGMLEKPLRFEPNIKYSPYTQTKLKWIKRLMNV
jgi:aldehyde dehydrogenase (NAD+)